MSGKKEELGHSVPGALKELWTAGFFSDEKNFDQIQKKLGHHLGCNPPAGTLRMALMRAPFLTRRGPKGSRSYIQRTASTRITLNKEIFPAELIEALEKEFQYELEDLRLNYGKSGTCTAFLLRKILEKLIFLTFAKNGIADKLKDPNGGFIGLNAMLKMAAGHTVHGKPFLMPKTANEIEGIKFLGDTSAHNPLVVVSMGIIKPVMPFIVTAYSELVTKL
ncbi:hypothetical protein [Sulfuricaulis sp.]|jgi:hypothetical protein|uniref:hypothetical protein n=1 Tax=Sulfuricaulis sp. TaxID=2003553 RepID=UPI00355A4E06